MTSDLALIARILAFETQRAVPVATHRKTILQPHALVLACLALAGEDTTIHIAALGRVGKDARLRFVPDPRQRDEQANLFRWLGYHIERYMQWCLSQRTFPQLIVSSGATAGLLDTIAERWRYARGHDVQDVRRMGTLLSWFTDRAPIAGQQTLLTATGLLNAHWVTGQQPGEESHLGASLVWHNPPAQGDFFTAVANAEQVPMGCKTDPNFDRDVLEPLVTAYGKAKRAGEPVETLAMKIEASLQPVVLRIYESTQKAVQRLQQANLPPMASLRDAESRESWEFSGFMKSRKEGFRLSLRDTPKAAAFKLLEREDAVATWEASMVRDDAMIRAHAVLTGSVLRGCVTHREQRTMGRQTLVLYKVTTIQNVLRLRPMDKLIGLEHPGLKVVVESIERHNNHTQLLLKVLSDQRQYTTLPVGTVLEMSGKDPMWHWIGKQRQQLSTRLKHTPWTHDHVEQPSKRPRGTCPVDPLDSVEALR